MTILDKIPQNVQTMYNMSLSDDKESINLVTSTGILSIPLEGTSLDETEVVFNFRAKGKFWIMVFKNAVNVTVSLF